MTLNCKVGDLAVIVSNAHPSNIGHIVEVLRPCPACELADPLVPEWECRMFSPLEGWIWFDDGSEIPHDEVDIQDRELRPISGVPVDDEVTDDLEVTA
jgi:hypothetical protein